MLKKGQAAMEFLMTYGWAILVVLIAIGASAYFGVLNPSRFLPESCTIEPGISCDDFKVNATGGGATLVLRNGMGSQLTGVTLTLDDDGATALCTLTCGDCSILDDGEQDIFTVASGCSSSGSTPGTKFKGTIKLGYTKDSIIHSKTGTLTTKVE